MHSFTTRMFFIVLFSLLSFPAIAQFEQIGGGTKSTEQITKVKLIMPLKVQDSKDITSMFTELKPEAIQFGLNDATLNGSVTYESLADKSVRVMVKWHSIGRMIGGVNRAEALPKPLLSQFNTKDARVEPGTIIKATGDLESVASSYLSLNQKFNDKNGPKYLVEKKESKETKEERPRSSDLGPSAGSGNYTPSGTPSGTSTNSQQMNTDLITTRYEKCNPRIDKTAGKVFPQASKIEETQSGRIISTGTCSDYGSAVDVVRTYDKCQPLFDFDNRKVYEQYTESANLDGKTIEVSSCTTDLAKATLMEGTFEGCGIRHDFLAAKSIQQEKLFYRRGATRVDVRECGDSKISYNQYLTSTTCTPRVEGGLVFVNKRTAYNMPDGTVGYASECRPISSAGVPVQEQFCEEKYEHDFTANQSYYRTKSFFVDDSGATQILSTCGRSTKISFPHIFQTSGCTTTNDDTTMLTKPMSLTQIETPDDGTITISPCQMKGNPVPYAFIRQVPESPQTIGGPMVGFSGGYRSPKERLPATDWTVSTFVVLEDPNWVADRNGAFNPISGSAITLDMRFVNDRANMQGAYAEQKFFNEYLRGDGTTYRKHVRSHFTIAPTN